MSTFLRPLTGAERHSSMDWCGASVALAWSPKNGEVFRNIYIYIYIFFLD